MNKIHPSNAMRNNRHAIVRDSVAFIGEEHHSLGHGRSFRLATGEVDHQRTLIQNFLIHWDVISDRKTLVEFYDALR